MERFATDDDCYNLDELNWGAAAEALYVQMQNDPAVRA
jgi:hypothetical protein